MMRDIKDSERIRTAIVKTLKPSQVQQQQLLSLQNLNTCIVSKGYWDSMQAEGAADDVSTPSFTPPAFLKKTFDEFTLKYQQFKRMRKVTFRPSLGAVQLTLTFINGSFRFRVTPLQAAIITLFNS
jgi:hypothetical protein